jgi:methylated-DNA-protein-cysteine methyltransferase-like protein
LKQSENRLDDLWAVVTSIPRGRCASYGDVGRALRNPASGRLVGMWMASCPQGVPWWRVVAKSGELPIHKRSPHLAREQALRLESEGVAVIDGKVDMSLCAFDPGEA